ncbi:MAG: lysylphosphatidylglycerol synthase transmembrane domain-containing protein [Bacteroidia bacterium]|nr:lysylphosphatidylglycerol synthase transmembrane domain-containing protein [Bacteroidia bacterium]
MAIEKQDILDQVRPSRIIWPILIGLAVIGFAIYKVMQDGLNPVTDINWTMDILIWVILGFIVMIVRDIGYMWRMRILTENKLRWKSAIQVTLLWEFSSALTPSVVGGSAVAIFMFIKEKISAGRSTAIVFITIFLDEMFYLVMVPISFILVGQSAVFSHVNSDIGAFGMGVIVTFWVAYGIIFIYTLFLAFALFFHPKGTSHTLKRLFLTKLFRRWQKAGNQMADDLLVSAEEFRSKSFTFWLKAWSATFIAWMGRYLVLNFVLAAFSSLTLFEHTVAFARQAIMFVVMIVSPTPGSSGVAEGLFARFFSEFSPVGYVLILATLWRLISYYPYLFIGPIILPGWVRRVFRRSKSQINTADK